MILRSYCCRVSLLLSCRTALIRRHRWMRLPQGIMLRRLRLTNRQEAGGSGADLFSYFNALENDPSGLPLAGLGRILPSDRVAKWGGNPSVPSRLAVRVAAMGGCNSPDSAQLVHI